MKLDSRLLAVVVLAGMIVAGLILVARENQSEYHSTQTITNCDDQATAGDTDNGDSGGLDDEYLQYLNSLFSDWYGAP